MANILSQDEVDSLLEGISEGKVKTETDILEMDGDIKAYDFSGQAGPTHLRMPALGIINERLITYLRSSLSSVTRSILDVNLANLESTKFGEFCRSIPLPASLNIFKMEPLRGFALVVLEGPLVFAFVDTFFGGRGVSHVKLEGRKFTTIETRIIDKITKIILADLQQAWTDIHEVKMIFDRSEMDPQFTPIVAPNDMVIVIRFSVDFPHTSGTIILCIPHATIEPIRGILRSRYHGEKLEVDQRWRRYFEKKIAETLVTVNCTLGTAMVSGRDLLEMKADDVIVLDQKVTDPIIVNVENIPKLKGHPGSCNQKKAIRLKGRFNEE